MKTYISKPKKVQAIQWTGINTKDVAEFVIGEDGKPLHSDMYEMPLRVWNELEDQWLNVPVDHYIIKGMKGEFYPCDPEVFEAKYEEVTDD